MDESIRRMKERGDVDALLAIVEGEEWWFDTKDGMRPIALRAAWLLSEMGETRVIDVLLRRMQMTAPADATDDTSWEWANIAEILAVHHGSYPLASNDIAVTLEAFGHAGCSSGGPGVGKGPSRPQRSAPATKAPGGRRSAARAEPQDVDEPLPRLQDLLAEKDNLRELDGWQVKKALFGLSRSLGVFEGNCGRLLAFLGQPGDARKTREALETLEFKDPGGFEKYLDETDRLLHNFLAAAESLKNHVEAIQKAHMPDLPGNPDTAEYEARKSVAFASPAGSFVRQLRHHVLHERIPETDGYAVWGGDPADIKSGIALDRSELRNARNWSKKAERFMDEAGDSILIHEVVAAYRNPVVEFCEWFDAALRRRNQRALEELEVREGEVSEALKKAWGPPFPGPDPDAL